MLFLLLLIELRVPCLKNKHLALLSDNDPTVTWTKKLTSRKSKTAAALLRVMATRLKAAGASPLIPMHIAGVEKVLRVLRGYRARAAVVRQRGVSEQQSVLTENTAYQHKGPARQWVRRPRKQ